MAGATLWGRLADACGRRVGFFGTAVFTFAFGVASAGSPNYAVCGPGHTIRIRVWCVPCWRNCQVGGNLQRNTQALGTSNKM